jgi:hypothetical protein
MIFNISDRWSQDLWKVDAPKPREDREIREKSQTFQQLGQHGGKNEKV